MKCKFWYDIYQLSILPYIALDFGNREYRVVLHFGWFNFGFFIKFCKKHDERGDF